MIVWKLGSINPNYSFKGMGFIEINAEWKWINFYFIGVYSPCNLNKINLWADLVSFKKKLSLGNGWGNFNVVKNVTEKFGKIAYRMNREMVEFGNFID